jgi:DNA-binding transcriptional regulator YhcF (GntR family)
MQTSGSQAPRQSARRGDHPERSRWMSTDPLLERVAGGLRGRIERGELGPGALLAPGPDLAAEYGVSRQTVFRARRTLATAGLLVRDGRRFRVAGGPPVLTASERVAGAIQGQIDRGELAAGTPLPSGRQLAKAEGVGNAAALRALRSLLAAGVTLAGRQDGRFVVAPAAATGDWMATASRGWHWHVAGTDAEPAGRHFLVAIAGREVVVVPADATGEAAGDQISVTRHPVDPRLLRAITSGDYEANRLAVVRRETIAADPKLLASARRRYDLRTALHIPPPSVVLLLGRAADSSGWHLWCDKGHVILSAPDPRAGEVFVARADDRGNALASSSRLELSTDAGERVRISEGVRVGLLSTIERIMSRVLDRL